MDVAIVVPVLAIIVMIGIVAVSLREHLGRRGSDEARAAMGPFGGAGGEAGAGGGSGGDGCGGDGGGCGGDGGGGGGE